MGEGESKAVGFLEIKGRRISEDEHGNICLNDLWEMAGKPESQRPSKWKTSSDANRLIVAMAKSKGRNSAFAQTIPIESLCYSTQKGGNRRVFAHPNLALAYAKYLSPELAITVNDTFLRYRRGDPALAKEIMERAEGRQHIAPQPAHRESLTQTQEWMLGLAMKSMAAEFDKVKIELEELRQEEKKRAWAEAKLEEERAENEPLRNQNAELTERLVKARNEFKELRKRESAVREMALYYRELAKATFEEMRNIQKSAAGMMKGRSEAYYDKFFQPHNQDTQGAIDFNGDHKE